MFCRRRSTSVATAILIAALSPLLGGAGSLRFLDSSSEIDRMIDYVKQHLNRFHFFPVLVPQGQRPGDVFGTDNLAVLFSRADTCFGSLTTNSVKNANFLPTREIEITQGIQAAIGLRTLAEAQLSWSSARNVRVSYDDVELISTEITALRSAFKSTEPVCQPLDDVIKEKVVDLPIPRRRLLVVIGSVVSAKRNVEIVFKSNTVVNASVSDLRRLIQEAARGAGLGIELPEIKAEIAGYRTVLERISFRTSAPVEVAFAPAFVPELIRKGLAGGPDADPARIEGLKWIGSPGPMQDPSLRSSAIEALDAFDVAGDKRP